MKNFCLILLAAFLCLPTLAQNQIQISGRVKDGNDPLPDVRIQVENTDISTFTDKTGRYKITVEPKQTVFFTYTGMGMIEYIAEDVDAVVNIQMYPDVQLLDEVVVEKRRKSQKELEKEYVTNKKVIKTGFGYIDQDRVGYPIRVIDGDRLSPVGIDFIGSLQSFIPGMQIYRPNGISRAAELNRFGTDATRPRVFLPRRFMSFQHPRPVAFEVDGPLMTDAPIALQAFNIERIAVISSISALAKYGQIAAGGLIIINTKGGVFDTRARFTQRFDQARRWDNVFKKEHLGRADKIPLNQAIEQLNRFESHEDALRFIENNNLISSLTVYNKFEVARILIERWQDEKSYLEIIDRITAEHHGNAVILKAAAYQLEEFGYQERALELYQANLKNRPNYAQSYRDLANLHASLGDTQKGIEYLGRYIRFVSLDTLSVPAQGIDSLIFTEYDKLLTKADRKRYDKRISSPEDRGIVRLVFEWNHGDAEFDLQFVNPANRYFTWQHSMKDTPDRIKDEKLKGYSSEQFFIDETMPGQWQVNMKYLGNKSFDPTYLRLTVYYNYGTPFEKQQTFVHRLSAKNVNYKLFSFVNNPIVSAASR